MNALKQPPFFCIYIFERVKFLDAFPKANLLPMIGPRNISLELPATVKFLIVNDFLSNGDKNRWPLKPFPLALLR